MSTVFFTFFIFPLSVNVLFPVMFKMVNIRQPVHSVQSINHTNEKITQRRQKEKRTGRSLRETGGDVVCYASKCFQKGKPVFRVGPNPSNPETPVLDLPSCCIVVATYFVHLYKTIPSG